MSARKPCSAEDRSASAAEIYHASVELGGLLRLKRFQVHFSSMLTAITRAVSAGIVNCELTFVARQPIELAKAEEQHRAYQQLLEKCGARVISLPAEPALPDSMFVEDPAIVLDELAIIFPLGTETRRPEAASIAQALGQFRKLACVDLPGQLEGGDILRVGRRLFAGLSSRTNAEGIRQLASILAPYGYEVVSVAVTGCLHLKSAVTYIGRNTLLANRAWFDTKPFSGFEWIDVAPEEPHAANAVAIGATIIFPASFPRTRARLQARGFHVTPLDISELQKAESGLTCSSLLFDVAHT
jgi:dimethylargininase